MNIGSLLTLGGKSQVVAHLSALLKEVDRRAEAGEEPFASAKEGLLQAIQNPDDPVIAMLPPEVLPLLMFAPKPKGKPRAEHP